MNQLSLKRPATLSVDLFASSDEESESVAKEIVKTLIANLPAEISAAAGDWVPGKPVSDSIQEKLLYNQSVHNLFKTFVV
jgi:hypothetical protein